LWSGTHVRIINNGRLVAGDRSTITLGVPLGAHLPLAKNDPGTILSANRQRIPQRRTGNFMAGLIPNSSARLWTIAVLRRQLIVNSLRSIRGRLNLVSRAFGGADVGHGHHRWLGFIPDCDWATAADHRNLQWLAKSRSGDLSFLAALSVMAAAFTQNLDSSSLLRFMSYSRIFLCGDLRHAGYCDRLVRLLVVRVIPWDKFR
jgi:hypothetical protein